MRRPNPWIAVPALLLGLLAAALGWIVTDLSCRVVDPSGVVHTCPGWIVTVTIASFAITAVGMATVLALVYRSLAEWREDQGGEDGRGG